MNLADNLEDIGCPRCARRDFVKNGKIRGMQRLRCKQCGLNFVPEPKHRWAPSSKLFNLVLYQADGYFESSTERARLETWLIEAKEHHTWFVRALAEHIVVVSTVAGEDIESAIISMWAIYASITQRDPNIFFDELAPRLFGEAFLIGENDFRDRLQEWLLSHSSPHGESA